MEIMKDRNCLLMSATEFGREDRVVERSEWRNQEKNSAFGEDTGRRGEN